MIDVTQIARTCHEVNKAYCEHIGDDTQRTWNEAPEWQKDSATNGVLAILTNPHISSEQLHMSWLLDKKNQGWKYGPVKNEYKKEHPCFVSYKDLPPYQRLKDALFGAVVRSFLMGEPEWQK